MLTLTSLYVPPPVVSAALHLEAGRHDVCEAGQPQTLRLGRLLTLQRGQQQTSQLRGNLGRVQVVRYVIEGAALKDQVSEEILREFEH